MSEPTFVEDVQELKSAFIALAKIFFGPFLRLVYWLLNEQEGVK